MAQVDFTNFHLAVIDHLGRKRDGQGHVAELGIDPVIKAEWTQLSLSKKKKMVDIIELRPDMYTRLASEKGAAMVKLTPGGMEVFTTKQLPPMSASVAITSKKQPLAVNQPRVVHAGVELPPMPANVFNPPEARKYFITVVLRCLAAQPELKATTSQLGEMQEIKEAWAAGGLNKSYKMIEIIKERPDLLLISTDAMKTNACINLTNLGMAYAPGFVIPDPDGSCPPPSQPKKLLYSAGGKGANMGPQHSATFGYKGAMPPRNDGLTSGGLAIGMVSGMPGMGVPGMSGSSVAGTGLGAGGFSYSPY